MYSLTPTSTGLQKKDKMEKKSDNFFLSLSLSFKFHNNLPREILKKKKKIGDIFFLISESF